ncbi:MAG: cytochrome c3 family protein [Phycisphaerales bacterium]
MRRLAVGLAIGLATAMGAAVVVAAQVSSPPSDPSAAQIERPTSKTPTCTTGGCHAKQLEHKFLHGPTAISACDACHQYADPSKHTFTMRRDGKQLCAFCHIDKTGAEGPFVHDPVAKGQCTGCHDPHGSSSPQMLKRDSPRELCTECHRTILDGAHIHKPAGEDCTACHKAHTSQHAKLLTMETRDLCVSCHEPVGKAIADSSHPHRPAEGDCLQCHRPHASPEPHSLKAPVKDLCVGCHEPVGKAISAATHPHGPTTDEKSCLNCHTAHASTHVKQLLDEPAKACLACHAKPIVVNENKTVPAVTELTLPDMHKHGPIAQGDCSACHMVHGGNQDNLLVLPFAVGFYQQFSNDTYALCFQCHDMSLVTAPAPDKETGFRDGARNLHAVHVDRGKQGRSCRACHNVHASRFPTLIADSVSFGEWKLPLNYEKTDTGGSCAPGCHKPASYDRLKPKGAATAANKPAATAATQPAGAPPATPPAAPPTASQGPNPTK